VSQRLDTYDPSIPGYQAHLDAVAKMHIDGVTELITQEWKYVAICALIVETSTSRSQRDEAQEEIDFREARLLKFYEIFERKLAESEKK
jgi:hypothetical protein